MESENVIVFSAPSIDCAMEQATVQVSDQPSDQVMVQPMEQALVQPKVQVQRLVNAIRKDVCTFSNILKRLHLKGRNNVVVNYLLPAIEGGYVLRAYPDKPNHPNLRYYISEKSLKLVKKVRIIDGNVYLCRRNEKEDTVYLSGEYLSLASG